MKVCTECGKEKPVEQFWFSKTKQYRTAKCDDCRRAANRRARSANLKANQERTEKWIAENREHVRTYKAEWYMKRREYHRSYMKQYRSDPAKRARQTFLIRGRDTALRSRVLAAYGGPICRCCGESNVKFLTLDHINNDGAAHRREIGERRGGRKFYVWIEKNGFPSGFQVLCMNCNWGKHRNGGTCPHMDASEGSTTREKSRTAEVSTSAAGSARHPMDCFYRPGVEEIVSTWQ